jgi:formylglycine-generating enzyme required for sulfatase activity
MERNLFRVCLSFYLLGFIFIGCSSDSGGGPTQPNGKDTVCRVNCSALVDTGEAGWSPYLPIAADAYPALTDVRKLSVSVDWHGMVLFRSKNLTMQMGLKDSLVVDDSLAYPSHPVKFTYDFYFEKTEVSMNRFADVMDSAMQWGWLRIDSVENDVSGWIHRTVHSKGGDSKLLFYLRPIGDPSLADLDHLPDPKLGFEVRRLGSLPADEVTWYAAALYANAWSRLNGLEPVYDTVTWQADYRRNGYRLPTEAESEYAIRMQTKTTYFWGADTFDLKTAMRYGSVGEINDVDAGGQTVMGLYQVVSNAPEWLDGWADEKVRYKEVNASGSLSGTRKAVRAAGLDRIHARSGNRYKRDPLLSAGFRLALPKR